MLKITLTPTDAEVQINGIPARIWQGKTDQGIDVHAYITRVAIAADANEAAIAQFEQHLQQTEPLRPELQGIPTRLVL